MRVLYSWSFVSFFMSFDCQILCSLWATPKALHIRCLMSSSHLFSVMVPPRYTDFWTCSSLWLSMKIYKACLLNVYNFFG